MEAAGGVWGALVKAVPELEGVGRVLRASTTAGLRAAGKPITGGSGEHIYVLVEDIADTRRFLTAAHERCWLAGYGWYLISASGQMLERSIVDVTVAQPERLFYEGAPVLGRGLTQDAAARRARVVEGRALNTAAVVLTEAEKAELATLQAAERLRYGEQADAVYEAWLAKRGDSETNRLAAEHRQLLPDFTLHFNNRELGETAVAQVLADVEKYASKYLADPLEGVDYGRTKAIVLKWGDGTPYIRSFAHGLTTLYHLTTKAGDGEADIGQVEAALAALTADTDWYRAALAAHAATGGSEAGWALLNRVHPTTREAWDALQPVRVTAGTLFFLADEARPGWREEFDARLDEEVAKANRAAGGAKANGHGDGAGSGSSKTEDAGPGPPASKSDADADKPPPKSDEQVELSSSDDVESDDHDDLIRTGGAKLFGGDRSKAVWKVINAMLRLGYLQRTIIATLLDRRNGISAHVLDQKEPRAYAERQVAKAKRRIKFAIDKNGKPYVTQNSMRVALLKMGVALSYNQFADRVLVDGLKDFGPTLDDAAMTRLRLGVETRFHFLPSKEMFYDVVADVARRNKFHPVRDYLDGLRWDGVPRIDSWLITYAGAKNDGYVRAVGALTLIAAVRRVRQPGCKFDELPVLESPQGLNKSSALRVMAVHEDWFSDDLPLNASGKETIEQTLRQMVDRMRRARRHAPCRDRSRQGAAVATDRSGAARIRPHHLRGAAPVHLHRHDQRHRIP